jgi:uncharacterized cupredoxin-like copper-binding protein
MLGRKVAVSAVVLALLSGCGSGGGAAIAPTSGAPTPNTTASGGLLLQPGDPAKADRTIVIMALNGFMFDPTSVSAHSGETVTFKVENASTMAHEFDVGDAAFQTQHEQEMRAMPAGMVMGDDPTAIEVDVGQTKEITLTFLKPATLIYGCHQPGHYASGMKGQINVT